MSQRSTTEKSLLTRRRAFENNDVCQGINISCMLNGYTTYQLLVKTDGFSKKIVFIIAVEILIRYCTFTTEIFKDYQPSFSCNTYHKFIRIRNTRIEKASEIIKHVVVLY